MNLKFIDPKMFVLWNNRLGHPGSIMIHRIIKNSHGYPLKNQKILLSNEIICTACSQGQFMVRPSPSKVGHKSPSFLQRVQGDICKPIHLPSELFRYFKVLIDASTQWSHVCLLSPCNVAFTRLFA